MTDDFAERLRSTLERHAASVGGPRFSADLIVHEGRTAVRRRRGALVAVAAATAVVLVLGWSLAGQRRAAPPPVPPGTPTSTPTLAPLPVASAGVSVLAGSTIRTAAGQSTVLDLPAGVNAGSPVRASGGWVVLGSDGNLWYVPDGHPARWVTSAPAGGAGDWAVSADGRRLVVVGEESVVYAIPSLQQQRTRDLRPDRAHLVALVGDRAVLRIDSDRGDSTTAIWHPSTGALDHAPPAAGLVWAVSPSGRALRRDPGSTPCLDVVPLATVLTPATAAGLCGAEVARISQGWISPDGAWVVLQREDRPLATYLIVRSDDLHTGTWRPVRLPPRIGFVEAWNTDTTYVTTDDSSGHPAPVLCRVDGVCRPLVLPPDLPEAVPLTRTDGVPPR